MAHRFDQHQRRRVAEYHYILPSHTEEYTGTFAWARRDGVFHFLLTNSRTSFNQIGCGSALRILDLDAEKADVRAYESVASALFNPQYFGDQAQADGRSTESHTRAELLARYVHLRLLDTKNHPDFGPDKMLETIEYTRGGGQGPRIAIPNENVFDFTGWTSQDIAVILCRGPTHFRDGIHRNIHPSGAAVAFASPGRPDRFGQLPYDNIAAEARLRSLGRTIDAQWPAAAPVVQTVGSGTVQSTQSNDQQNIPISGSPQPSNVPGSPAYPTATSDNHTHRGVLRATYSGPFEHLDSSGNSSPGDPIWPPDLPRDILHDKNPKWYSGTQATWAPMEKLIEDGLIDPTCSLDAQLFKIKAQVEACRHDLYLLQASDDNWRTTEYKSVVASYRKEANSTRMEQESEQDFRRRHLSAIRSALAVRHGANKRAVDSIPSEFVHLIVENLPQIIEDDNKCLFFSVFRSMRPLMEVSQFTLEERSLEIEHIRRCEKNFLEDNLLLPACKSKHESRAMRWNALFNYHLAFSTGGELTDEDALQQTGDPDTRTLLLQRARAFAHRYFTTLSPPNGGSTSTDDLNKMVGKFGTLYSNTKVKELPADVEAQRLKRDIRRLVDPSASAPFTSAKSGIVSRGTTSSAQLQSQQPAGSAQPACYSATSSTRGQPANDTSTTTTSIQQVTVAQPNSTPPRATQQNEPTVSMTDRRETAESRVGDTATRSDETPLNASISSTSDLYNTDMDLQSAIGRMGTFNHALGLAGKDHWCESSKHHAAAAARCEAKAMAAGDEVKMFESQAATLESQAETFERQKTFFESQVASLLQQADAVNMHAMKAREQAAKSADYAAMAKSRASAHQSDAKLFRDQAAIDRNHAQACEAAALINRKVTMDTLKISTYSRLGYNPHASLFEMRPCHPSEAQKLVQSRSDIASNGDDLVGSEHIEQASEALQQMFTTPRHRDTTRDAETDASNRKVRDAFDESEAFFGGIGARTRASVSTPFKRQKVELCRTGDAKFAQSAIQVQSTQTPLEPAQRKPTASSSEPSSAPAADKSGMKRKGEWLEKGNDEE